MKFKFVAKQKAGSTISDQVEANSKIEARKKLIAKGYSIISLKVANKKVTAKFKSLSIGWVRKLDIALFTKNFSVMLKSGLTVSEALEVSSSQATGKFKKILKSVLHHVEEGSALADSFAHYPRQFKDLFVDVIRLGEKGGTLEGNLQHLSVQLEKELILKRKINATLIYPIFILVSTVGLGVVLATFVLPRLSKLFTSLNMELPWSTKVILWVANAFQNYSLWIALGFVVLIVLAYFFFRIKFLKPFWHYALLNFPITGRITHIYNLARICRNFGVLLKSGLPIDESMQAVVNAIDNAVYKKSLRKILEGIKKGDSLSDSMKQHNNLFPPMVVKMVNVGEKSGQLEEILIYLAKFYEEEVDNITKNLASVIEPLLLIFIGLIVGFVGVSIITPIYQITGSISPTR